MSQSIRMFCPDNINISAAAPRDIENILKYTRREWGAAQVVRYRERMDRALAMIGENFGLGYEADGLPETHRVFSFGSHVLIYRRTGKFIRIFRILHQRMNHKDHL